MTHEEPMVGSSRSDYATAAKPHEFAGAPSRSSLARMAGNIAAGYIGAGWKTVRPEDYQDVARMSVRLARAILEEL